MHKIPKNEILKVTYSAENGKEKYVITYNTVRNLYFLYKIGKTLEKISQSNTPIKLENQIIKKL